MEVIYNLQNIPRRIIGLFHKLVQSDNYAVEFIRSKRILLCASNDSLAVGYLSTSFRWICPSLERMVVHQIIIF